MHLYTNLFGLIRVPSYGLMIGLGVVLGNLLGIILMKRLKSDFNDFIILEGYGILGGFIGAKALYIIVSYRQIDWNRFTDIKYFNNLMQGGFVFYGGLIGGLLFTLIAGRIHKIDAVEYIRKYVFLLPFIHGFGRVGCFLAGCCYGVPYHGPFAVTFPKESYALPDIALFPIQLIEAIFLFIIAISMIYLELKREFSFSVEFYFITYGLLRFVLEFFRYDDRGKILYLSTSQFISIGFIILSIILVICKKRKLNI